ncbi:MAG: hypothetical protein KDH99_01780 [Alcanivoracaceae bacterium]|nr:hypothetical protein [Alcanivoracaceae bacterium]
MIEKVMNSGLFAGIAALLGFGLAFFILKLSKVETPHEHKAFYPIIVVVMILAYVLRSAVKAMV